MQVKVLFYDPTESWYMHISICQLSKLKNGKVCWRIIERPSTYSYRLKDEFNIDKSVIFRRKQYDEALKKCLYQKHNLPIIERKHCFSIIYKKYFHEEYLDALNKFEEFSNAQNSIEIQQGDQTI